MSEAITEFRVRRGDLRRTEVAQVYPELAEGQAKFRIDRFALTANNITYAAFGEAMHYWDFFPAPDGWGIVPVWGFATCTESRVAELPVGEHVYGYWPMASHAVLTPGKYKAGRRFTDVAPHRAGLAAAYNGYGPADTGYEARYALFRPLYTTSFLIDDDLAETVPEAQRIIVSSASSKTALGLAQALKARAARGIGPAVIGLTSAANIGFVEATGYYDQVLAYEALEQIDNRSKAAFVDFAGNADTRARIHRHLGSALVASLMIGATDWDAPRGDSADLPGARPTLFFAPTVLAQRIADWGPAGFDARLTAAWEDFIDSIGAWLEIVDEAGAAAVGRHYRDLVEGRVPPQQGIVLRF